MSVFNDGPSAFSATRAHDEYAALRDALVELGERPLELLGLTAGLAVEDLRAMAAAAVRQPPSRAEAVRQNLAVMPRAELVQLIVERPSLTLTPDPRLKEISPDSELESYDLTPLYGLMFPRDHLLQVHNLCFVANFRRDQRQVEAELVARSVAARRPQLDLVRLDSFFEGGDAVACRPRQVLFLGHGHRSDRRSALRIADAVAPHGWSTVLLPDRHREPEEFHLDHWAAVVGDTLLCDERRVAGLREVEWVRPADSGAPAAMCLDQVLELLGMTLLPVPRRIAGPVGFNLLDLPDAGAVVCSRSAPAMVAVLQELGRKVVSVEFATFESNFGSVHCATNELL
jgi:N-dimethylarginine dimethylaminohydrolase